MKQQQMEFGIFLQANCHHRATDPVAEWNSHMADVGFVKAADRAGFKYAWAAEHHSLVEYSHLSAPEAFMGFALAQTERIHLGSGIAALNPQMNSPVRRAENAATLDLLSQGRFEFGTGRGAGSHEIGTFDIPPDVTRANWDEVIRELPKMWHERDYSHDGPAYVTPERDIVPKPYGGVGTHPPLWVSAGNPPTFEKAARLGIGVLGFNFAPLADMVPLVQAYKAAVVEADPVGRYVNDNVMISSFMVCLPDGEEAYEWAVRSGLEYNKSLVYHYHDTFPKPEGAVAWPDTPPPLTLDDVKGMVERRNLIIGSPAECRELVADFAAAGIDQLAFNVPHALPPEVMEECLRCFGAEVIPHFDTDPVHRTSRMRYGSRAEEFAADPTLAAAPFDSAALGTALDPSR
jgi:alkanesulfonate monooxygenase SsuD/methylene tetrahydromethanopterin reductase-like flavin-dependent oxidoreductase (luciferase family)